MKDLSKIGKLLIMGALISAVLISTASAIEVRGRHRGGGNGDDSYSEYRFHPAWSLNLGFDEVVDDNGDYRGFRLGVGYQMTPRNGFRVNLDLFEKGQDYYEGNLIRTDDYSFTIRSIDNFEINGGKLSMDYMYYTAGPGKARLYFGVGPVLNFEQTGNYIDVHYDYYTDWIDQINFDESLQFGAGLGGSVGGEIFFGPNFSFTAEYGIAVLQKWYFFDVEYIDRYGYSHHETESYNDGLDFEDSHIRLGFNAYF